MTKSTVATIAAITLVVVLMFGALSAVFQHNPIEGYVHIVRTLEYKEPRLILSTTKDYVIEQGVDITRFVDMHYELACIEEYRAKELPDHQKYREDRLGIYARLQGGRLTLFSK